MSKWIPDQKVLAGGLAGLAAFLLVVALQQVWGVEMDPVVAGGLILSVAKAVDYLVPPSVKDRIARADAEMKNAFKERSDA